MRNSFASEAIRQVAFTALLVLGLVGSSATSAQAQKTTERTRWEFGQFEFIREFTNPAEVARWTVGDSVIVSTKSLDNLIELVTRRRDPKVQTQHSFFNWLGDQGWEMVSCDQADPTEGRRTMTLSCWFKRPKL